MKIYDLSVKQLKRAATIKEAIEKLNKELQSLLGVQGKSGHSVKKGRTMSAATKKRIAAAQKARWAKLRRARSTTALAKSGAKARKKTKGASAGA